MVILLHGRNTAGIARDVEAAGYAPPYLIVTRDGDDLPVPDGLGAVVEVSRCVPPDEVTLVANGGTTMQLVGVIGLLLEYGRHFRVVEVARGGAVTELLRVNSKLGACMTLEEARSLYYNTSG